MLSDLKKRNGPPNSRRGQPKLRKYYSSTTLLIRDSDYNEGSGTSSSGSGSSSDSDENENDNGLAIADQRKIPQNSSPRSSPRSNNKNNKKSTLNKPNSSSSELGLGNIDEVIDEHQPLLLKVRTTPNSTDDKLHGHHHHHHHKHHRHHSKTPKIGRKKSNTGKAEIESINLADEIKGALIFHIPSNCFCKDYTVRIYLHYWIWQVPVLITNIILFCIWNTTHNNPNPTIALTEVGFLAVGPVFLSALVRDKIFLWGVYWAVKKTPHLGCTRYGMMLYVLWLNVHLLYIYIILALHIVISLHIYSMHE